MSAAADFAARLIGWQKQHGRHDFPWLRDRSPYRVWIAEIMLQQTRAATVEAYFERFVAAFPSIDALAAAPIDEVLHLWSGLGYYARARNLHRTAQLVVQQHAGELPRDLDSLTALPGIGRSTAAAILAQAYGQRAAILDANARRVLARHAGVEGRGDDAAVLRRLWALAEERTPVDEVVAYTQGIMDLGATVCVPRTPDCAACPVAADCVARLMDRVSAIPAPRKRRARPQRETHVLLAQDEEGRVLLQRRPARGIWGGLWGPPELAPDEDFAVSTMRLGLQPDGNALLLAPIEHAFTHFDLRIFPWLQRVHAGAVLDDASWAWYNLKSPSRLGMAAPVAALLARLLDGACERVLDGACEH